MSTVYLKICWHFCSFIELNMFHEKYCQVNLYMEIAIVFCIIDYASLKFLWIYFLSAPTSTGAGRSASPAAPTALLNGEQMLHNSLPTRVAISQASQTLARGNTGLSILSIHKATQGLFPKLPVPHPGGKWPRTYHLSFLLSPRSIWFVQRAVAWGALEDQAPSVPHASAWSREGLTIPVPLPAKEKREAWEGIGSGEKQDRHSDQYLTTLFPRHWDVPCIISSTNTESQDSQRGLSMLQDHTRSPYHQPTHHQPLPRT